MAIERENPVTTENQATPSASTEDLIASDLVLLLLKAGQEGKDAGRLDGITRLEKLLFLANEEEGMDGLVDDPFTFKPYHYGPYSREVYEAVELLEEAGLVSEERFMGENQLDEAEELAVDVSDELGVERRFRLTESGETVADLLASKTPEAFKRLATIKSNYGGLSLNRLIRYVYSKYPTYAEKSVIRESMT